MALPELPELAQVQAITDSNIMLEVVSCVDLVKLYTREKVDAAGPEATLRRQKARESTLLAMYLDSIGACTFSLFEAARVTRREVDPNATDRFENHAMIIWAHYIKDKVFPNWTMLCPSTGEEEPIGNRADRLLVECAGAHGVPLISHEGVTKSGIDEACGIRRKAKAAGVRVLTPREFYGDMDESLQSALFMQKFEEGADDWAQKSDNPEIMLESIDLLRNYYRHILFGVTNGYSEPLPVRLR